MQDRSNIENIAVLLNRAREIYTKLRESEQPSEQERNTLRRLASEARIPADVIGLLKSDECFIDRRFETGLTGPKERLITFINIVQFLSFIAEHYPQVYKNILAGTTASNLLDEHIFSIAIAPGIKYQHTLSDEDRNNICEKLIIYLLYDIYHDVNYLKKKLYLSFSHQLTTFIKTHDTPHLPKERSRLLSFFLTSNFIEKYFIADNLLNALYQNVLFNLYFKALKIENECSYFLYWCTAEEITQSIKQQINENKDEVVLYWDQLFFKNLYLTLDEKQKTALQEAFREVSSVTLLCDVPGIKPQPDDWKFIASLIKQVPCVKFSILQDVYPHIDHPLLLTEESLASFAEVIEGAKLLDLSNFKLDCDAAEASLESLACAISHCTYLRVSTNIYSVLMNLPEHTSLRYLDLSRRTFLASVDNINELAPVLGRLSLDWLNLDHCGFDSCSAKIWKHFCEALKTHQIHCQFVPISNLPEKRQEELDTILRKNAYKTSLVAGCTFTIWQNECLLKRVRDNKKGMPEELTSRFLILNFKK